MKNIEPKEKDICKAFVGQFEILLACGQFRNSDGSKKEMFLFHVANEQHNSKAYTMMLKGIGLKAGVADYCLILGGGRVAFIEFKRSAKCSLSESQVSFAETCNRLDTPYLIAWDVDTAIEWIKDL